AAWLPGHQGTGPAHNAASLGGPAPAPRPAAPTAARDTPALPTNHARAAGTRGHAALPRCPRSAPPAAPRRRPDEAPPPRPPAPGPPAGRRRAAAPCRLPVAPARGEGRPPFVPWQTGGGPGRPPGGGPGAAPRATGAAPRRRRGGVPPRSRAFATPNAADPL